MFLHVARERTLSGAARKLNVDQSTVGRRLAALEKAAGARLFDRMSDGYALSVAGESVLASVVQIEGQALAVEQKLQAADGASVGKVRVATSDSFAAWFLIRQLPALYQRQPGIVVELITGNQPVDLARREADISVRLSKPTQPHLVARRLGIAAWACYASRAYIEARGQPNLRKRFAGHDVVAFDDELSGTIGARWLSEHADQGNVVMRSNSMTCQGAAVVCGLGVSALPCLFGDREPSLVRLAPGIIGHHDIWLVVHPDVKASARVRAVFDFLSELMPQQVQLLSGQKAAPTKRPARR